MKNLCGKMRKVNEPYEVWRSEFHPLFEGPCEWRVLKKYQTPEKEKENPFARWMCAVKSACTGGSYDMGDTYIQDIIDGGGHLVWTSHGPMEIDLEQW